MMPADQGLWLHDNQGLAPVAPTREPDQSATGGVGHASGLDLACLIQRQLFAQKKVFGGQGSGWTETEPQEAHNIA
jgi:hypothetical protein